MLTDQKEHYKGKVFPKGQIVIPAALRKKYKIQIGDSIDFILSNDGILIKPVIKFETEKPLAEKLFGIFSKHEKMQVSLSKRDILHATEHGFTEEWNK